MAHIVVVATLEEIICQRSVGIVIFLHSRYKANVLPFRGWNVELGHMWHSSYGSVYWNVMRQEWIVCSFMLLSFFMKCSPSSTVFMRVWGCPLLPTVVAALRWILKQMMYVHKDCIDVLPLGHTSPYSLWFLYHKWMSFQWGVHHLVVHMWLIKIKSRSHGWYNRQVHQ